MLTPFKVLGAFGREILTQTHHLDPFGCLDSAEMSSRRRRGGWQ
jgi:hypothetical protein